MEDSLTSDLAAKTCSNFFMTSGGVTWSFSAPSIAIGILTPERKTNNQLLHHEHCKNIWKIYHNISVVS